MEIIECLKNKQGMKDEPIKWWSRKD
jgi:hypothetical protein